MQKPKFVKPVFRHDFFLIYAFACRSRAGERERRSAKESEEFPLHGGLTIPQHIVIPPSNGARGPDGRLEPQKFQVGRVGSGASMGERVAGSAPAGCTASFADQLGDRDQVRR